MGLGVNLLAKLRSQVVSNQYSPAPADGGTRTLTEISLERILSPVRSPRGMSIFAHFRPLIWAKNGVDRQRSP